MTSPRARSRRGAIIGFGFIASHGHLPAYLERQRRRGDVEIVAVADVNEARRLRAKELLPEARIYEDHRALLAAEVGQLDFADVCTPPAEHAAIAGLALDAGLHVLCEKPLTTKLADAGSLLVKAAEMERVIYPCHNYKHAPMVRAIRHVVSGGSLGALRAVSLATFRTTHARGVAEWNPDWRRQRPISGGGIGMDHGSHSFYLAFEWMRGYPTAITAKLTNLTPLEFDTEDNFAATLTFQSGLAHTQLSWTAGCRKVLYSLHGERGALIVDDDHVQIATTRPGERGDVEHDSIASRWEDASHTSWFDALFDEFCAAIDRKEWVGKDAIDAYRCVEVITTAYRSAREGCRELALGAPLPLPLLPLDASWSEARRA